MDFSENTGMLIKAIRFAAGKHRNQRRKDSLKSPYINHPIEVLLLLWEVGQVRDSEVLLAAVLHDTVEDTNTSAGEISETFGEKVAEYVLEVSDDKSLPKKKRKQKQIEEASQKSQGAKLISLGDKSCNLCNLNDIPPQHWNKKRRSEYLQWSEQVVAGLRGTNEGLEGYYDQQLARGKKILGIN
jgi:guanosine-3',5'-bis(diphosphate) 3'-pyrophosphohydrolase